MTTICPHAVPDSCSDLSAAQMRVNRADRWPIIHADGEEYVVWYSAALEAARVKAEQLQAPAPAPIYEAARKHVLHAIQGDPDRWWTVDEMAGRFTNRTRDRVSAILRDLHARGYLQRELERRQNGGPVVRYRFKPRQEETTT